MPLIDVTYDQKVGEEVLRRLGALLPEVVGEAVECPEEPSTGPLKPGDIEIRFRRRSPLDVGDLDVVIEVRTKLFEHRVRDRQRRADLIRDRLSTLPLGQLGVWLILSEGAWSQSENQGGNAMGEYQTDARPMDVLRTHLKAIRTASARIDPEARRGAVRETLPERIAALASRVSAKLEASESRSADDSNCDVLVDIAVAAYEIADESSDPDEIAFWEGFGESVLDQADECYGGGG